MHWTLRVDKCHPRPNHDELEILLEILEYLRDTLTEIEERLLDEGQYEGFSHEYESAMADCMFWQGYAKSFSEDRRVLCVRLPVELHELICNEDLDIEGLT